MTKTMKRILLTIGVIVGMVLVFLAYQKHVLTLHKLSFEVEALDSILVLFVEDNGRMPRSMQELFDKDYLTHARGSYPYPTVSERLLGRYPASGYGLRPHDMDFEYLSDFGMRFDGQPDDKPLLFLRRSSRFAKGEDLRVSSNYLEFAFTQAQSVPSASSPTAVPTPTTASK